MRDSKQSQPSSDKSEYLGRLVILVGDEVALRDQRQKYENFNPLSSLLALSCPIHSISHLVLEKVRGSGRDTLQDVTTKNTCDTARSSSRNNKVSLREASILSSSSLPDPGTLR